MTTTTTRPSCIATGCPEVGIYVACLASYNGGILYGAWVDLEECQDREDLDEAIAWMLKASPSPGAEEYAIHDSCGLPGFLRCTEWPDLDQLIEYSDAVTSLPDADQAEAYRLACDDRGQLLTADEFAEAYQGQHRSGEDYAQGLAEELGVIPEGPAWPVTCIDWEQAWRELTFDGYREEDCNSGGVHIFRTV